MSRSPLFGSVRVQMAPVFVVIIGLFSVLMRLPPRIHPREKKSSLSNFGGLKWKNK